MGLISDTWSKWKTDEWLVTREASRLFLISLIFIVAATPVLFDLDFTYSSSWQRTVWEVAGFLGLIPGFFMWSGMLPAI